MCFNLPLIIIICSGITWNRIKHAATRNASNIFTTPHHQRTSASTSCSSLTSSYSSGCVLRLTSVQSVSQWCPLFVVVVIVIIDIQIIIKNYRHRFPSIPAPLLISGRIKLKALHGMNHRDDDEDGFPIRPARRTFDAWNT